MEVNEIEVGTFEAKNKLSSLVDRASRGGRIWITKRGRRVALLSSGSERGSKVSDSTLADQFRKLQLRAKSDDVSLKELIEEGRR
jgi:prevent-host-death family protein